MSQPQLTHRFIGGKTLEFVYTASASSLNKSGSHPLPSEPELFPSLSITEKALLHHFTHEASRVTCAPHVQHELCQLILPMAAKTPSLMQASLAWSAIHSLSFGRRVGDISDPELLIAKLKAKSIKYLRRELQDQEHGSSDALLATVRSLCQCEIHSGSDGSSAWRVHVKGAKALMRTVEHSEKKRSTPRLLDRWYAALDSLAALTPSGNFDQEYIFQESVERLPENAYIDDYNGYSTDVSHILGNIGAAIAARRQLTSSLSDVELEMQASNLQIATLQIMDRENSSDPSFYPGVIEKLSPQAIKEYSLCNQAYQHTALIHVHRRLKNLSKTDGRVQDSVKKIIECVRSVALAHGLSPAIVLTTPLFTAGCEAMGEDREAVRDLLLELYEMLRIRNIKITLDVLESCWASDVIEGDCEDMLRMYPIFGSSSLLADGYLRPKELGLHSILNPKKSPPPPNYS